MTEQVRDKGDTGSPVFHFSPRNGSGQGSGGCNADGRDYITTRRTSLWIRELVGGTWGEVSSGKAKVKVKKVP